MKKVLIVTLPQGANYGGMLQAYALQAVLSRMNFDVETTFSTGSPYKQAIKSAPVVRLLLKRLRGDSEDKSYITQYTKHFVDEGIKLVDFKTATKASRRNWYDAYVVGSDQVWRKSYSYVPHNLLSFTGRGGVKISYAASFGQDDLSEYDSGLLVRSRKFAAKFDAISVREDSGIDLVKSHWGLGAEHHVDPTLLIEDSVYAELVSDEGSSLVASGGELFAYVLDKDPAKQGIVGIVAQARGIKPFTVIDGDENSGKPMPRVTQWLRSFMDAKYIVTDSFHGTVFSIIFNKPFIAIGNKERGLARFTSLLKMFGLEDRLVTSADDVTEELINKPIDWKSVNAKIKAEQKRSMEYLRKHLG